MNFPTEIGKLMDKCEQAMAEVLPCILKVTYWSMYLTPLIAIAFVWRKSHLSFIRKVLHVILLSIAWSGLLYLIIMILVVGLVMGSHSP